MVSMPSQISACHGRRKRQGTAFEQTTTAGGEPVIEAFMIADCLMALPGTAFGQILSIVRE
jgi:hypothetical protein